MTSPPPAWSHSSYSCAAPCRAISRRTMLPSQCGQRSQALQPSSVFSFFNFSYALRFVCFAAEYRFAFITSCANRHIFFGLPLLDCSILSISPARPLASYASRQRYIVLSVTPSRAATSFFRAVMLPLPSFSIILHSSTALRRMSTSFTPLSPYRC